jgi:bacteriochlorophyll C8 methyltransferase
LKILLITPKGRKEEASGQKPLFTMAMGVLVSITPKQHQVELVDELFDDPIDYDGSYDMVGITTRTCNATRAYEIADEFQRRGTTVILGGVHVSFNYEEASPHCNAIVCGEAENLWTTLLQDVACGTLKPYYDSADFEPVKSAPRLDYKRIFQCSKREKVDSRKSIPIYLTRGCPFNCSFCVTPNFTGKLYRIQEPDAVREQMEEAKQAFFKETPFGKKPWFMFTDENFGVNKKKTWETLEMIKELHIKFSTFISINFLEDPRTVKLLVEAGCAMALVGFESINQETLNTYGKRQNSALKFVEVIEHCRKAGLSIQGNFLVNPAIDTYEDMAAVEKFVRENHLMMPLYSIMTPYPGTNMYWEYKDKALVVDEDWDKYNANNLVVKCERYDPLEYQIRYLEHFLHMYSWSTIFYRVVYNRNKLINFVTSVIIRKNLQDQLKSIREGRNAPMSQVCNSATSVQAVTSVSIESGKQLESNVH